MNLKLIKCYLEKKDCHSYRGGACICLSDTTAYKERCPFYKSQAKNLQEILKNKMRLENGTKS